MKNKEKTFYNLSPVEVDIESKEYQINAKQLRESLEDREVKNIAITGCYGSGKSSFVNSFIKNEINRESVVRVSTPYFSSADKVANSKKNFDQSKDIDTAERQIYNQILSQIDEDQIPLSECSAKSNNIVNRINFNIVLMIFSIIISLLVYLDFNRYIDTIDRILFSLIIFFTLNIYGLTSIIRKIVINSDLKNAKFRFSIFEFSADKYNKVEKEKNFKLLDIAAREIAYIIRASGKRIVIFEDLDRFENLGIFSRLREINTLINLDIYDHGDPIKFIYVINDNLLLDNERTKFFDSIIYHIPYFTKTTARDHMINIFDGLYNKDDHDSNELRYGVLVQTAFFINDLRIIKSIYNDYVTLSETRMKATDMNSVFAICVVRNVFPKEFSELENNSGLLYECANLREKLIRTKSHDGRNLKYIIETNKEKAYEELQNIFNNFNLETEKAELIEYFIINGYFNENYSWYKDRTFESRLCEEDIQFFRNVILQKDVMLEYEVKDPEELMQWLGIENMALENGLNYSLFKYFMNKDMQLHVSIYFLAALDNSNLKFQNYLSKLSEDDLIKVLKMVLHKKSYAIDSYIPARCIISYDFSNKDLLLKTLKFIAKSLIYKEEIIQFDYNTFDDLLLSNPNVFCLNFMRDDTSLVDYFKKKNLVYSDFLNLKSYLNEHNSKVILKEVLFEFTLDNIILLAKYNSNDLNLCDFSLFNFILQNDYIKIANELVFNKNDMMQKYRNIYINNSSDSCNIMHSNSYFIASEFDREQKKFIQEFLIQARKEYNENIFYKKIINIKKMYGNNFIDFNLISDCNISNGMRSLLRDNSIRYNELNSEEKSIVNYLIQDGTLKRSGDNDEIING